MFYFSQNLIGLYSVLGSMYNIIVSLVDMWITLKILKQNK